MENTSDFAWLDVARAAIQDRIDKYSMGEIKFNLMAICSDRRLGIQMRMNNLMSAGITDGDEMLEELRVQLMEEEAKRLRWKEENDRRRHNYFPLFLEILRSYARTGKLHEMTLLAKQRGAERKNKGKA
jgi:ubiquitin carboxyl-terminal hydrolase L5